MKVDAHPPCQFANSFCSSFLYECTFPCLNQQTLISADVMQNGEDAKCGCLFRWARVYPPRMLEVLCRAAGLASLGGWDNRCLNTSWSVSERNLSALQIFSERRGQTYWVSPMPALYCCTSFSAPSNPSSSYLSLEIAGRKVHNVFISKHRSDWNVIVQSLWFASLFFSVCSWMWFVTLGLDIISYTDLACQPHIDPTLRSCHL